MALALVVAGCKGGPEPPPPEPAPVASKAPAPEAAAGSSAAGTKPGALTARRGARLVKVPGKRPPPARRVPRLLPRGDFLRVGATGVIGLPVRGFGDLQPRERLLAYHLSLASAAGRDIAYGQHHPHGVALRDALRTILAKVGTLPRDLRGRLRHYLRQVWLGNGPYHPRTGRKIAPTFTLSDWRTVVERSAASGVDALPPVLLPPARVIFDPADRPDLWVKRLTPAPRALLTVGTSYVGVSEAHLAGFTERFPINSRLVVVEGAPAEEVYRAGRPASSDQRPVTPGLYAGPLSRVVGHLRGALPHASDAQQATLRHLIRHLETGAIEPWDAYWVAWLGPRGPVDIMVGFIETDWDPRGVKGRWQGLVTVPDAEATALAMSVASLAQYVEDHAPWVDEYKRSDHKVSPPVMAQVLTGHGAAGPVIPTGIDLPNSVAIRAEHGSRTVLLTNVIRALNDGALRAGLEAFAAPKDRALLIRYASAASELTTLLHEVVGHAASKPSRRLAGQDPAVHLKELTTVVEEARAELVALHFVWDPRVSSLHPGCPDQRCAEAAYRAIAMDDLMALRHVAGDRIEDDHRRARHLIVQYAAAAGAVRLQKDGPGGLFQVVTDLVAMRSAVSRLLAELTRIRAEGDYDAARKLLDAHGLFFDPAVRDRVRVRAERVRLPTEWAFVMSEPRAKRDRSGRIREVSLSPPPGLDDQMTAWDRASAEERR